MSWSSDEAYLRGIEVMSEVVQQVPSAAWSQPSPCDGWRALDVLGHVGSATDMGVRILRGGDLHFVRQDPPGDAVEGDPQQWWNELTAPAQDAVASLDEGGLDRLVDTPMGQRSVRDGLRFPAADLFLHAWDIAKATGVSVSIPDEAVPFVRSLGEAVPPEMMRSPGVFGAEVPVPADASAVDRLLGWCGRDPSWQPATT